MLIKQLERATATNPVSIPSWHGVEADGIASNSSRVAVTPETSDQSSNLILFLLDVAKDSPKGFCFLGLAKDVASRLICDWRDFSYEERSRSTDTSFTADLSNCAFALAEVWKITREPICREATLEMLRYASEVYFSQATASTTCHQEGRR